MADKSPGLIIVLVILSILLLGSFIFNLSSRECSDNKNCSDDSYCGSDFECHKYPEEIIVEKNNYIWPAVIFGVSLISAAYLFNRKKELRFTS